MNIIIKTKNIEMESMVEAFINDKVGKLEKFLHVPTQEVFVDIEKETNHHKKGDVFVANIKVVLPGKTMVARGHGEDLMQAITDAKDEIEVEIKKHKLKTIELPRREAKKAHQEEGF